jgi:hypothetical protein
LETYETRHDDSGEDGDEHESELDQPAGTLGRSNAEPDAIR